MPPRVSPRLPKRPSGRYGTGARAANWIVGLAAIALTATSLGSYFYHRRQLDTIAAGHLRLLVMGPSEVQPGVAAEYSVTTTTVTGDSLPALIELALYSPDGKRLLGQKELAENGQLQMVIPADMALPARLPSSAQLKVVATRGDMREEFKTNLAIQPIRYVTRLTLDKARYRPGETVYFRSVSLSRFGLTIDRALPIRFEILDPSGKPLPGSTLEGTTDRGVGCGALAMAEASPGGVYTLVARSLDGSFADQRQTFAIDRAAARRFDLDLEFLRNQYGPGDHVVADVSVKRPNGTAAETPLSIAATVDGQTVFQKSEKSEPSGRLRIDFSLPKKIQGGRAELTVTAEEDGGLASLARPIPVRLAKLDVAFYPDGGALVEGVENHVYVTCRDSAGKPAPMEGKIIDSEGEAVAGVETGADGLGSFSLAPDHGETYRLRISRPEGMADSPALPAISPDRKAVLSVGSGLFAAGAPLEFTVRSTKANLPLLVTARCRGVTVGQRMLVTKASREGNGTNSVAIPLDDSVGGTIRLTAYDYSSNPPSPIAERLVFRAGGKRLKVRFLEASEPVAPGETKKLSIAVTNEKGEPAAALLGISAREPRHDQVDGAVSDADLQFLLAAGPEKLEGRVAADSEVSISPRESDKREPDDLDPRLLDAKEDAVAAPPVVFDNLGLLRSKYEESLTEYRTNRTQALNTLIVMSFFGGLALALLVTMLALLKIVWGSRLWLPTIVATVCCIVVSAVSMDPSRVMSVDRVAVAFTPYGFPAATPAVSTPVEPAVLHLKPFAMGEYPGAVRGNKDDGQRGAIAWHPLVVAGLDGRAQVTFTAPAEGEPFQIVARAQGDGRLGVENCDLCAFSPLHVQENLPAELTIGDRVDLPVKVSLDHSASVPMELLLEPGKGLVLEGSPKRKASLSIAKPVNERFALRVAGPPGECELNLRCTAGRWTRSKEHEVRITSPGGPLVSAISGWIDSPQKISIRLPQRWSEGSLGCTLYVFPSPLAEIEKAVEGLQSDSMERSQVHVARCVLNTLALRLIEEHDGADPEFVRLQKASLESALMAIADAWGETGGYRDLAGATPDEAVTAWTIAALSDAQSVGFVDKATVQRAAGWLAGRLDAKSGSDRLHALATWALVHAGQKNASKEAQQVVESARKSEDAYLLALAALIALETDQSKDARPLLDRLARRQAKDGRVEADGASPLGSRGASLQVETTSLAALAWLKLSARSTEAQHAVAWLLKQRHASGGFGTPAATAWALSLLCRSGVLQRTATAESQVIVLGNNTLLGQKALTSHLEQPLVVADLAPSLKAGDNSLTLSLTGKGQMAYLVDLNFATDSGPPTNSSLKLSTQLASSRVKAGETVALTVQLQNTGHERLPATIAVVGLPAGLGIGDDQIKALKKSGAVDMVEIRGRNLWCFWGSLASGKPVELKIDMKARLPGRFTGPASAVFQAADPDQKQWVAPLTVEVAPGE